MISYTLKNSTFDLGNRPGLSSCEGLFAEMADLYAKNIVPQLKLTYETDSSTMECLLTLVGKQTIGNTRSFVFQNGLLSVTVDDEDNVNATKVGDLNGIVYLDTLNGDIPLDANALNVASNSNIFVNVGSQVGAVTFLNIKLKNALATNASIKIADITPEAKAVIGNTYLNQLVTIEGTGKVTKVLLNTWEDNSEIVLQNTSGANIGAGAVIGGTFFFMRT